MKSSYKFILAFGVIFMLLFLVESNQDEPIDWSPGFGKNEKKPFGNYLLFELLPELFKEQKIETVKFSIIDQLDEFEEGASGDVNYIFIDEHLDFNVYECDRLLDFVRKGNMVFLASANYPDTLMSSLALKENSIYDDDYYYRNFDFNDTLYHFNFCNNIKSIDSGYTILRDFTAVSYYFDSVINEKKILAADDKNRCVLTEIKVGKGKLILSALPYLFTNYYMAKPGTRDFILRTLTRMPLQIVWWDEHYKSGKNKETPLRFILDKKSLKWSYYLALGGLLLFVVFMGKRRQRIIPIQDPMKNTSLEFAETVGQVYYEKGDHLNLAMKQIKYLAEYIRSKYYINVSIDIKKNRTAFLEHLSNKSGKPLNDIEKLFNYISYVERSLVISEKELIYLNSLIEKFKTPSKKS